MKHGIILAAALLLAAPAATAQSTTAAAAPAASLSAGHRKAAEDLLQASNAEKNMAESIDRILTMQTTQNPALKTVEPEMRAYLNKYMGWSVMKEDLVQLYAREFTEKELKELTKFYQTPVGRKTMEKMPQLLQAGMEIGQRRTQEHLPELQQAIAEKMKQQEGKPAEK
ncbi:DUF2059 domain-containing protein [Hymenobacter weizhouensis]|uniref:DUF2059 domain-containing protein n=1 Tax=Hymenobacter sp. YIM 151500-1 TaxID=2987689 RepID=UPI002226A01A|nr:DUF2059 domain-containing protein [Hymenobacter sp. YIM 151500-1]UYZ63434.1 DUF2059 domain-containing protein [Hymenobacter sp. YIM 151500-1]